MGSKRIGSVSLYKQWDVLVCCAYAEFVLIPPIAVAPRIVADGLTRDDVDVNVSSNYCTAVNCENMRENVFASLSLVFGLRFQVANVNNSRLLQTTPAAAKRLARSVYDRGNSILVPLLMQCLFYHKNQACGTRKDRRRQLSVLVER